MNYKKTPNRQVNKIRKIIHEQNEKFNEEPATIKKNPKNSKKKTELKKFNRKFQK